MTPVSRVNALEHGRIVQIRTNWLSLALVVLDEIDQPKDRHRLPLVG